LPYDQLKLCLSHIFAIIAAGVYMRVGLPLGD
jgi:hypothetical protein